MGNVAREIIEKRRKQVFLLYFERTLTQQEIAKMLDWDDETIYRDVKVLRERISQKIRKDGNQYEQVLKIIARKEKLIRKAQEGLDEAKTPNEVMKLSDLKELPGNPNELKGRDKEKIYNSLDKEGYLQSLVVNIRNNHIVGGNHRYKYLIEKGYTEAEVVEVNLDDNREKALALFLNTTGENNILKLANFVLSIDEDTIKNDLKYYDEEIENLKLLVQKSNEKTVIDALEKEMQDLALEAKLLDTPLKDITFRQLLKLQSEFNDLQAAKGIKVNWGT